MKTLDLQEVSNNAMLTLLAALLVEDARKEAEKQVERDIKRDLVLEG